MNTDKHKRFVKLAISVFLTSIIDPVDFCKAQLGEWTWMHGDSTLNQAGVYGTKGVSSPSNKPGARYGPSAWTDPSGNFWLFGGVINGPDPLNDLWKYDITTNEWTWMDGDNISAQPGIYGTQGIPSSTNKPGARGWGCLTWVDLIGNLWLFGGYGYDAVGTLGSLGDLWKFNPSTNEWTWMKGPQLASQPGNYGTQGIPSTTNTPPARSETTASWVDDLGNLWLFGGYVSGTGYFSDLWKYNPLTNE
ncbi:MAG: hypothetical protein FVQ77_04790 [Cytophagales bacterium]|nr:hypothetical protein [Cytophagales bacterium]